MRHSAGECHITNMRSAGEYALSVENFRGQSYRGSAQGAGGRGSVKRKCSF
jgi:hypothetical protein